MPLRPHDWILRAEEDLEDGDAFAETNPAGALRFYLKSVHGSLRAMILATVGTSGEGESLQALWSRLVAANAVPDWPGMPDVFRALEAVRQELAQDCALGDGETLTLTRRHASILLRTAKLTLSPQNPLRGLLREAPILA